MNTFNSARRELLRLGGVGATTLAVPFSARGAFAQTSSNATAEGTFDVRRYGATGDGRTVDSPAINRAIEAAAAAGGGVVVFPAGTYVCFSIRLKSQVHLELQQGCILLAADSPRPGEQTGYRGGAYDAAEPKTAWDAYQDYGHNHWHNSLLWGEEIHDFSITGSGLIWGKGLSNGRRLRDDGAPFVAEQPGVGNKAIALKNCRNVLLRDFSMLKAGHFGLLLTGVDNVTIDNLTIDTDRDGIDLDCCQNMRVSNCTVNAPWDDAICPKSSYALGYARPTRNVTITNCLVTGYYQLGTVLDGTFKKYEPGTHLPFNGRVKCGTESNGGFINITISNCVFEGCYGYALESVDGALIEDITITNTTMRDLVSGPLFLRLGARLRGPKESRQVGTLRRILISNLDCYNATAKYSSVLSGIPGYAIEDVKLSNIYVHSAGGGSADSAAPMPAELENHYPEPNMFGVTPSHGFFLRHMRNLEMSHVEVAVGAADARPAFYLSDVERADFFAVTAPRSAQGAFALRDVKDVRVGWSRAAADVSVASAVSRML